MARRQITLPKAALVERKEITEDLMIIKMRPETVMTFKPGQYCTLGLEGIERAYSIVSAHLTRRTWKSSWSWCRNRTAH